MKKLILLVMLLCSCGSYQYINDTMLITETTDVSMFSNYDADIIRFVIKPIKPRFYFANNYGYWGMRPLWFDFNFYHGNYDSYYSHFYRPWNYWDYYMRPSWTQGPFNNLGYNVVYNSSRRTSIENNIVNRPSRSRVILNKKTVVSYKPVVKPIVNYNNSKPIYNNSKPIYNNNSNFNNKPSFNSTPSYNSKPSTNNSRSVVTTGVKKGN